MKAFFVGLISLLCLGLLLGLLVLSFPLIILTNLLLKLAVFCFFVIIFIWLVGKLVIFIWEKIK